MSETRPLLADTIARIRDLQLYVEVRSEGTAEEVWVDHFELASPDCPPIVDLFSRFEARGFAANKKAAAASLLLRLGWAAGFTIASYLACSRVPYMSDFALHFGPNTLVRGLWVRKARFSGLAGDPLAGAHDWGESATQEVLRARLIDSLIGFAEPIVESQHRWSRFSRFALWSMVTSSWAGQFTGVARQLGDADWGASEARAVFALAPEIARAAPDLYEVRAEDNSSICQRRTACCLYFKAPGRRFCASCPIIPSDERLARNRAWVAQQSS